MKMTLISIACTWLCATGVAVISHYNMVTSCHNDNAKPAQIAKRISQKGTIPEYKPKSIHSSACKKTTAAKVGSVVKLPTYVDNPMYGEFTNVVNRLTEECAEFAKSDELSKRYGMISIGGISIGDELKDGSFAVLKKECEETKELKIDEITFGKYRRLDEPEFYCTEVTYSAIPSTKQVYAINMHGTLSVEKLSRVNRMIGEIKEWMKNDYEAKDLHVEVPEDLLAYKVFKIGDDLEAEISVRRLEATKDQLEDAVIDIAFTTVELDEERDYEGHELGRQMDEVRVKLHNGTGVNYYTVRPRVSVDAVNSKIVY